MHFPFFFLGAKAPIPPQIGSISSPVKASFFGHKNALPQDPHSQRVWEGVKFPYIRKFISVYAKIFFRICGNLFPCGRKFFAVRKEKNFRAHARKILCAQKFIFMRTEIFFCAHRNFAPCPRKRISFRKGENFLGQAKALLGGEGDEGRRRACTLAGHREGLVCRYSLGASPMSFMYLRTS